MKFGVSRLMHAKGRYFLHTFTIYFLFVFFCLAEVSRADHILPNSRSSQRICLENT